ncbi:hypothetical protein [Myxacorys almedinensis]|uniref:Uncharacterized protein n=1 Tax=Myxacorys almedinensis A TaxID=2690445 RepID=A0A8J7Z9B2_9CYAN|nr:hypothetical protein [Myxacorys almedinensis]NDJ18808.1 hypothetical protein [Myxacorys almedinensis A]
MNNFSFDELQRKDLLIALGLWLVVELVSFVFFPAVRLIHPGAKLRAWFIISVPLGLGGSVLIGASSRFMAAFNETASNQYKGLYSFLGQFGGWIGLAGVLFPLGMVCVEFFSSLGKA